MNRRNFLVMAGAAVAAAAAPVAGAGAVAQPPAGKARFRTGLVVDSVPAGPHGENDDV